jgi:hypothetical protein
VLDAALEKKGIHTVTVVWDNFENAARTQARLPDVTDLELVVVPYRKGGETDDQRRKALPAVIAKLVEPI